MGHERQVLQPHAAVAARASGLRRLAFQLDRAIGHATEAVGAVIVLAETCILFAGVVSRYVFDDPIIWTDELANFLFCGCRCSAPWCAARRRAHAPDHPR